MARNKPAGSASRLRRPASAAATAMAAAAGLPAPAVPAAGPAPRQAAATGYTLAALLMVGSDPVTIDPAEDDNLHFMAEHIDPA